MAILEELSKRAPAIAIFTFCTGLLCAWLGVPLWLSNSLAILVAVLALALATRGRRHQPNVPEDATSLEGHRNWLSYELAGKGTPPGFYLLGFFGFVTIMLTGFRLPDAAPAWAGFGLAVVWGIVNASYPAEEDLEE